MSEFTDENYQPDPRWSPAQLADAERFTRSLSAQKGYMPFNVEHFGDFLVGYVSLRDLRRTRLLFLRVRRAVQRVCRCRVAGHWRFWLWRDAIVVSAQQRVCLCAILKGACAAE